MRWPTYLVIVGDVILQGLHNCRGREVRDSSHFGPPATCGGGLRHECASRYSPVAQWMCEVELALHDESQQCGNLDETAAIARLPRNLRR